jgi:molecular chaperone IbpA
MTVGFEYLNDLMGRNGLPQAKYPPYNIERLEDNTWSITVAVAGFSPDDIEVTVDNNVLTVSGSREQDTTERDYVYKGIANRDFELNWRLGEYVEVDTATCENGLLTVQLVKKVPDELKPRKIEIKRG